ncbi:hypothetical protein BN903_30 [Halorubrum sp. AJ67]|nr:hypothetical protein BN903_30 [Halorubrum sp. AJ67]
MEAEHDRPEDVREHEQADVGRLAAEVRPEDDVGDGVDDHDSDREEAGDVREQRHLAVDHDRDRHRRRQRDVDDLHPDHGDEAGDARDRTGQRRVRDLDRGGRDRVVSEVGDDRDDRDGDDVEQVPVQHRFKLFVGGFEVLADDRVVVEPEQPVVEPGAVDEQVVRDDDGDEEVQGEPGQRAR